MSKSNEMYENIFDSTPDYEVNSKRVDLEFSLSKAISPMQVCDQIQRLCTKPHLVSRVTHVIRFIYPEEQRVGLKFVL